MLPYRYIKNASKLLACDPDADLLLELLDELEYVFETIDPEFQDRVIQLIEQCNTKLSEQNSRR